MSDIASGRLYDVSADLVSDDLWERIAALLPARPTHRHPGRLPASDRVALAGIVYRLHPGRGDHVGPSPVDHARLGSKHHLIVDRHGTPLAITLTGGNRHDVTQLPLLDTIPSVRGLRGRPRRALGISFNYGAGDPRSTGINRREGHRGAAVTGTASMQADNLALREDIPLLIHVPRRVAELDLLPVLV